MPNPLKKKLQLKRLNSAIQAKAKIKANTSLSSVKNPAVAAAAGGGGRDDWGSFEKSQAKLALRHVSLQPVLSAEHSTRASKVKVVRMWKLREEARRNKSIEKSKSFDIWRKLFELFSSAAAAITAPFVRRTRPHPFARASVLQTHSPSTVRSRVRRRRARVSSAPNLYYGSIEQLQKILGLDEDASPDRDVIFLALDLEWERKGIRRKITEIGITTLRMSDIVGVEPGAWLRGWKEKMEHVHIVTHACTDASYAMSSSLFAKNSLYMTRSAASAYVQNLVTTLLSSTTTTPPTPMTSPRIIVVGQSVWTDIVALRYDRSFRLHLPNMLKRKTSTSSSSDSEPSSATTTTPNSPFYIFDTHKLALSASASGGQFIGGLRLASIALNLGIEAQYRTPRTDTRQALQDFVHYGSDPLVGMDLKGCHNASNDAAYALMTMLLLGLRWREFVGSDGVRAGKVWEQTGGLIADVDDLGERGSGDTGVGGTFGENEKSSKEKKLLSWREWLGQTLRGCFRVEK